MAILGNNNQGAFSRAASANRMSVSKFTLASAETMTELHCWFQTAAVSGTVRIVIYADSSGDPGARVAYTSLLTLPTDGLAHELSETGFSVSLAAGDYWLGWKASTTTGATGIADGGGTRVDKSGAAADPPDNPFGATGASGTEKYGVWAVVGPSAAAFVPQIVIG